MTDREPIAQKHTEATRVFVPVTKEGRFAAFAALATGRQLVYAFTSVEKAQVFLRVMRAAGCLPGLDRLLPCTLGEWFDWQPKKHLPDLAIDADPHAMADYPLRVPFDPDTQNLRCLTTEGPDGPRWRVHVSPRRAAPGS